MTTETATSCLRFDSIAERDYLMSGLEALGLLPTLIDGIASDTYDGPGGRRVPDPDAGQEYPYSGGESGYVMVTFAADLREAVIDIVCNA